MRISGRCYDQVITVIAATCVFAMARTEATGQQVRAAEREPNPSLASRVANLFADADVVATKYLPDAGRLYAPISRDDLEDRWKYSFSYRCTLSCRHAAAEIQSFFSAGVRLEAECPDRYYAIVELRRSDGVRVDFYVQDGGHCFTLENQSYYVEQSFDRFVQQSELFPRFVE